MTGGTVQINRTEGILKEPLPESSQKNQSVIWEKVLLMSEFEIFVKFIFKNRHK